MRGIAIFPLSGRVKSCQVSPEVWLSTPEQTSDPSFAWKKESDVLQIKDDDDDDVSENNIT